MRGSAIKEDIFAHRVPMCPDCDARALLKRQQRAKAKKSNKNAGSSWDDRDDEDDDDHILPGLGVMKPCITFFGEKLSDEFDICLLEDREKVDLLIVMGTSLKVAPVSELIGHLPHATPVILINRTPVLHMAMDIQLLGDADAIVAYLCQRLGWALPPPKPNAEVVGGQSAAKSESKQENGESASVEVVTQPQRLADSHIWLFPGAEAQELIEAFEEPEEEEEDEGEREEEEKQQERQEDKDKEEEEILPTTQEFPPQTQTQCSSLDSREPALGSAEAAEELLLREKRIRDDVPPLEPSRSVLEGDGEIVKKPKRDGN